jgi:hypothetical protein
MKTLRKGENIVRVQEADVLTFLRDGYEFCSKEEWKQQVRDAEEAVESKREKKKNKKKKE